MRGAERGERSREEMRGAERDGKVYALGGMAADTTPQALVRVYEPEKDQWQALTSMPTPRYGAASFLRGNKIYVLGRSHPHPPHTPIPAPSVQSPHCVSLWSYLAYSHTIHTYTLSYHTHIQIWSYVQYMYTNTHVHTLTHTHSLAKRSGEGRAHFPLMVYTTVWGGSGPFPSHGLHNGLGRVGPISLSWSNSRDRLYNLYYTHCQPGSKCNTQQYTHTLTRKDARACGRAHTHTHARTHAHTHTHTLSLSFWVAVMFGE
ncbi:unnamed protein product [Coregonus sp. 'balchen']|nr:unnamed protein product [Coregonus sp. 'balchen']